MKPKEPRRWWRRLVRIPMTVNLLRPVNFYLDAVESHALGLGREVVAAFEFPAGQHISDSQQHLRGHIVLTPSRRLSGAVIGRLTSFLRGITEGEVLP